MPQEAFGWGGGMRWIRTPWHCCHGNQRLHSDWWSLFLMACVKCLPPPDKSPVSQRFPVRGDEISVALFSYASLTNHTKSLVSGHHAFLNSERVPFFHMHLSMPSGLFYCQCTDYLTLSRFTVWPYCTVSTHESVNLRCADFQCRQYYYH